MSDGRLFTDYRPNCELNLRYPPPNQFVDSYKYRQYLINNADSLLGAMRMDAHRRALCAPCVEELDQPGTMLPAKMIRHCDGRTCAKYANDPYGLGTEIAYGKGQVPEDNRQFYWEPFSNADAAEPAARTDGKTTPAEKRVPRTPAGAPQKCRCGASAYGNCCAPPVADLRYYPIDPTMVHRHPTGRLTIPYGGFAMAGGDPTIMRMSSGRVGSCSLTGGG